MEIFLLPFMRSGSLEWTLSKGSGSPLGLCMEGPITMFSQIISQAVSCRLVLPRTLPIAGLGGRGELTKLFVPICCFDLRVKLNLSPSPSFESEFDFFIPLNLFIISILQALVVSHYFMSLFDDISAIS